MKKINLLLALILTFALTACSENKTLPASESSFKAEYEEINGLKNTSGLTHRTITINDNNPFQEVTAEEIVKKIENKETFYVYFGSAYCPWCRSVIEKAIEVANKKNIDKIYYVDIWDGDHVEILRDVYTLNEDGKLEQTTSGTKAYEQLLKYLDNVLSSYNLTDSDGNKVPTGEKRITAPNFIYIENGKAIKLETGISSKQTNSRAPLTDEILTDEENKFNAFFEN